MLKKIILYGRVQGVGCRGYCASCARKAGLRGSASNMRDGSVEIIIEADSMEKIRFYIDILLFNPYGFYFHGRIDRYTLEDYSGPVRGDYRF
jgi:acylphosphatase